MSAQNLMVVALVPALGMFIAASGIRCGPGQSAVDGGKADSGSDLTENKDAGAPIESVDAGGPTESLYPHWADGGLELEFVSIQALGDKGWPSSALVVNEQGVVIGVHGNSDGSAYYRPYQWTGDLGLIDIDLCKSAMPVGLTDDGILALSLRAGCDLNAPGDVILYPDGGIWQIDGFIHAIASGPYVLTSRGQLIDPDGGMRDFVGPTGHVDVGAIAVADNGWAVGSSRYTGWKPLLWESPSSARILAHEGFWNEASLVTATGFIAGIVGTGGVSNAAVWYGDVFAVVRPTTPFTYSGVTGLNDEGVIVGVEFRNDPDAPAGRYSEPFIWGGGQKHYLDALLPPDSGWDLFYVQDVNSRLDVVGVGKYHGEQSGFVLRLRPTAH